MENREIRGKGNVGEIGIRGRVRDYWALGNEGNIRKSGIFGRYITQGGLNKNIF